VRQIQLFVLFILLIAAIAFPLNLGDNPTIASGQELTREMSNWDMINYGKYGTSSLIPPAPCTTGNYDF